jgi:hypothetical protein
MGRVAWRRSRSWRRLLQRFGGGKGDDGSTLANRCGLEEACGRADVRESKPKLIKNLNLTQPVRCVRLKSQVNCFQDLTARKCDDLAAELDSLYV